MKNTTQSRLLVISYAMPPLLYPRALQMQKVLNGLAVLGLDITVVCASPNEKLAKLDYKYAKVLNKNIKKVEVLSAPPNLLRKGLNLLSFGLVNTPDENNIWALRAFLKIKKSILSYENVLTIGKYDSDHLTGFLVKLFNPKIKWAAFFSDPWSDNPYSYNFLTKFFNRFLEKIVIKSADNLIFVNEETKNLVMKKYSGICAQKAVVIPHCFDESLYAKPTVKKTSSKTVIAYIGNFYKQRNPQNFLIALSNLLKKGEISKDNFAFEIYGAPFAQTEKWIQELDLSEIAFYKGQVDYLDSLTLMKSCDVLLVIDASADENVFLTSKVVDYIGSKTFVFAITPVKGATAKLVNEYGGLIASPEGVEGIEENILKILKQKKAGTLTKNLNFELLNSYLIKNIARKYLDVLIKKRILFTIGNFGFGGKERQLAELIKYLPCEKYDIYLLVKSIEEAYLQELKPFTKDIFVLNVKKFNAYAFIKFLYILKDLKPDIVCGWSTLLNFWALISGKMQGARFELVDASIRSAPAKLSMHGKIEKFLYNFYPIVIANSYAGLQVFDQHNKKHRHVIYNGFDLNRIPKVSKLEAKDAVNFPTNKFCVVMAGRLDNQKDHVTFIDSAKLCLEKDSNLMFYIAGLGPYESKLKKYVNDLAIGENVIFLGHRGDIELIFLASDLSILVSTDNIGEGTANVIIESMAAKTPVLASKNAGNIELFGETLKECLIYPKAAENFCNKILELKNSGQELNKLSKLGYELVLKKFGMKKMIAGFEKIIESFPRK